MPDQEPDAPALGEVRATVCHDCGETKECTWQPDPFAEEIRGDDTPHWQCADCAHESAMDI